MSTSSSTTPRSLRLGTRGSLLARTQSQWVADTLRPFATADIQLVFISTAGDRQQDRSLAESGGKGLFVKEIEEALLDGRIDLAVHSAKDMPMEIPPGLLIGCTPPRELPNDMWIGHQGMTIEQLPPRALVGTTSLRRKAQLLARRPDLQTVIFRGNIDTRLRKVAAMEGGVMGTFLAAAGLRRAGLVPPEAQLLPVEDFIPAAGQGTLALECRQDDAPVRELLAKIHDPVAFAALEFERRIVQAFAGSCLAPIGVHAQPRSAADGGGWIVRAIVASPDGRQAARATLLTQNPTAGGLGDLAPQLIAALESRGARDILAQPGQSDEPNPA